MAAAERQRSGRFDHLKVGASIECLRVGKDFGNSDLILIRTTTTYELLVRLKYSYSRLCFGLSIQQGTGQQAKGKGLQRHACTLHKIADVIAGGRLRIVARVPVVCYMRQSRATLDIIKRYYKLTHTNLVSRSECS